MGATGRGGTLGHARSLVEGECATGFGFCYFFYAFFLILLWNLHIYTDTHLLLHFLLPHLFLINKGSLRAPLRMEDALLRQEAVHHCGFLFGEGSHFGF